MSPPRSVVSVGFTHWGRSGLYALPDDLRPAIGQWVVVESGRGRSLGTVAVGPHEASVGGRIRRVLRVATSDDLAAQEALLAREPEAFRLALTVVRARRLPLKLVRVVLDAMAGRATFGVVAPDRIDLGDLARELGEALSLRVEVRQLGMRDVARALGGLGRCGQELCCSRFLDEYPKTSIRMGKDQGLSLAEDRSEGVCGRTLCCLAYEQEFYRERRAFMPKLGKRASTVDGLEGKAIGVDVMRMTFTLLDDQRTRHVVAATAWDRNVGREVPAPELGPGSEASRAGGAEDDRVLSGPQPAPRFEPVSAEPAPARPKGDAGPRGRQNRRRPSKS